MTLREQIKRAIGPCYFADDGGDGGAGGSAGSGSEYDVNGTGGNGGGSGNEGNDFNFGEFKNTYAKDYLDKPYMQAIDSPERLFKEFDNAQNLIGKKINIPGPDATDKEQDDYLNMIRPKDKSVYKLPESHLPDNLKGFHNEGFEDKITDLFQKAALTPKQASILAEGYDNLMLNANGEAMAQYAEMMKAQAMNDADFNALADKTWGQEREAVQNVAKSLIQQFTPPEFKTGVDNLSNENLVILASVLKGVSDKYISQDDLNILKGSGHNAQNLDSLKSEAQNKMATLMNMEPTDPKYDILRKEVDEIYGRIGRLSGDK